MNTSYNVVHNKCHDSCSEILDVMKIDRRRSEALAGYISGDGLSMEAAGFGSISTANNPCAETHAF